MAPHAFEVGAEALIEVHDQPSERFASHDERQHVRARFVAAVDDGTERFVQRRSELSHGDLAGDLHGDQVPHLDRGRSEGLRRHLDRDPGAGAHRDVADRSFAGAVPEEPSLRIERHQPGVVEAASYEDRNGSLTVRRREGLRRGQENLRRRRRAAAARGNAAAHLDEDPHQLTDSEVEVDRREHGGDYLDPLTEVAFDPLFDLEHPDVFVVRRGVPGEVLGYRRLHQPPHESSMRVVERLLRIERKAAGEARPRPQRNGQAGEEEHHCETNRQGPQVRAGEVPTAVVAERGRWCADVFHVP